MTDTTNTNTTQAAALAQAIEDLPLPDAELAARCRAALAAKE